MTFTDINGQEYDSPETAIKEWKDGCGEIIDESAPEDEQQYCTRGSLCTYCEGGVDYIIAHQDEWNAENKACDMCGEACGTDDLRHYHYSEWTNGRKHHHDDMLCIDCYRDHVPEIDVQAIAAEMTDDASEREAIVEAIENNIKTNGTAWKLLLEADEDRWEVLRMMGVARDRHENTDYDDMLRHGISRDAAREFIKS